MILNVLTEKGEVVPLADFVNALDLSGPEQPLNRFCDPRHKALVHIRNAIAKSSNLPALDIINLGHADLESIRVKGDIYLIQKALLSFKRSIADAAAIARIKSRTAFLDLKFL